MKRSNATDNEDGFTLLETLLALAVVAIVATLSTVALSGRLEQLRAADAVEDVANTLREGQLHALQMGREVSVTFDRKDRTLFTLPTEETQQISNLMRVAFEVDRSLTARDQATIIFFPDGSSSGGRVRLVAGARNYEIEVDWLSGLISQRRLADAV